MEGGRGGGREEREGREGGKGGRGRESVSATSRGVHAGSRSKAVTRPRRRARGDSGCGETNLGVDAIVAGIPLGDSIGVNHAPYCFCRARRAHLCRHAAISLLTVQRSVPRPRPQGELGCSRQEGLSTSTSPSAHPSPVYFFPPRLLRLLLPAGLLGSVRSRQPTTRYYNTS